MSRKSSRLCRILFTALLAALILVVVPYAKVKADDEDRLIDFDISFDGAQSYDEYEVYYAFNPVVATDGAISYTKVEGDFANGKTNGYYHQGGVDWSLYGAKFVIDGVTWGYEPNNEDTLYIKVVTNATDSKPAKTIMYGNARGWDNDREEFCEKQLIGKEADKTNYSFINNSASMSSCTYEITAKLKDFKTYTALNFGLAYPRQGDTRAKKYIEGDIFAYGDIDASGSVDENDIRKGIAVDLCRKYFWEEGGILSEYYEIRHPNDILNSKKLYSEELDRLTVTSSDTVSAYDKDGTEQLITKYKYSLELGYSPDGTLITASGVAYGLDSTEKVLIQAGNTLYIRDVVRDNEEDPGDEVAFGNYGETPAVCVVVDDFNSIKFGGNGVSTNYDMTYNPDGSTVLCAYMMNDDFAIKYNNTIGQTESFTSSSWPSDGPSFLRIIDKNNRYVIVESCDGSKRAEGIQKDPVCMTGDNAYVETFAGYKELKITSLSDDILGNMGIKDIKLVDRSMSKGVRINPINEEDSSQGFKVTFKSNFYDEVPIEITYEDDVTQTLTIKRIALVVRYVYLADPTVPGNENADFCYDFGKTESKVDYNYGNGEQIIIYAQYYHTENDNSDLTLFLNKGGNAGVEIINKNIGNRRTNHVYRKDATDECVAETFFLLGFARAHDEENHSIDKQNVGAWDAMVLNAGYDGSSSFGGAQFGSGAGFHWDGQISWQY